MMSDWLEEEDKITAGDIRREVAVDPEGDKALGLTGLEPLIIALAVKAVTGIASGLAGRASYDMWKKARTRKEMDELRASLRIQLDAAGSDPVDEATIRHDLVETLVAQGLTPRQARKVVDGTLQRVITRLQEKPA